MACDVRYADGNLAGWIKDKILFDLKTNFSPKIFISDLMHKGDNELGLHFDNFL